MRQMHGHVGSQAQRRSHGMRVRAVGQARSWAVILGALALGAVASLLAAGPAFAGLQQEFSVFADCPVTTPGVTGCIYSKVSGGQFTLGSKTVTINKTIILQGGTKTGSSTLVPPTSGEMLSRTALTVPGGLVGIEGLGGEVTATAEPAGAVTLDSTNLLDTKGTAVSLPLQVKLDNPFLGSSCYIGSASGPVSLNLTTGTTNPPKPNTPITGSPGTLVHAAGNLVTELQGSTLVDNAFAVPGAQGCGGLLFLLIDPLVDVAAGVPAAAGHNTAIMNGELETVPASVVVAQAALPELGRCVTAPSTGSGKETVYHGGFADKACTEEESSKKGRYEWESGAGAGKKFTGKGKVTLEGVDGATIKCSSSTTSGEYTGAKTLTASLVLSGCESKTTKQACQSTGAAAGEIRTSPLAGTLGFVKDEAKGTEVLASVGVDLSHSPSLFTAECGGISEHVEVKGSVIVPISKVDKMSSSFSAKAAASNGKQVPEEFEGGAQDTLTATLGAGAEQAGLTTSDKLSNEEQLEIKAIAK